MRPWIGIISAVPGCDTVHHPACCDEPRERHAAVRGAMIATAIITALGFAVIGTQHVPLAVFLAYAVTSAAWTPTVPLTDAYALTGCGAIWPRLRPRCGFGVRRPLSPAALGCGLACRCHCGQTSDLDHRRHRRGCRPDWPPFAALIAARPNRRYSTAHAPCCAMAAFSPSLRLPG